MRISMCAKVLLMRFVNQPNYSPHKREVFINMPIIIHIHRVIHDLLLLSFMEIMEKMYHHVICITHTSLMDLAMC